MFTILLMRLFDLFGVAIGSTRWCVPKIFHGSEQKAKEIQARSSCHIYFHIINDNSRSGDYFYNKSHLLFGYCGS